MAFLEPETMAYDNLDWIWISAKEIRALLKKNQPFLMNLAVLRQLLRDLYYDSEVIEDQLY